MAIRFYDPEFLQDSNTSIVSSG